MNQQGKIYKYGVFSADVRTMSDAELEASLQQLRDMTSQMKLNSQKSFPNKRAA